VLLVVVPGMVPPTVGGFVRIFVNVNTHKIYFKKKSIDTALV